MTKEYFGHDYGTRHKKKMAPLVKEYKARGYGLFWIIVEMLHEDTEHRMALSELTYISISAQSGEPLPFVQKFVGDCISRYQVFVCEDGLFTTSRVLENIDRRLGISVGKSEAGKKGAAARWQNMAPAIPLLSGAMADDGTGMADDGKVKESKEKESKSNTRPKGLTAALAADSDEVKALKEEYNQIVASLEGKETVDCWNAVKAFVGDKQPSFVEPFVDLWNIFALTHHLIKKPIRITPKRLKKFQSRIKERDFDFIGILAIVKKSRFLRGDNERGWKVSFEFIIDSEENYTKILEEKYE